MIKLVPQPILDLELILVHFWLLQNANKHPKSKLGLGKRTNKKLKLGLEWPQTEIVDKIQLIGFLFIDWYLRILVSSLSRMLVLNKVLGKGST